MNLGRLSWIRLGGLIIYLLRRTRKRSQVQLLPMQVAANCLRSMGKWTKWQWNKKLIRNISIWCRSKLYILKFRKSKTASKAKQRFGRSMAESTEYPYSSSWFCKDSYQVITDQIKSPSSIKKPMSNLRPQTAMNRNRINNLSYIENKNISVLSPKQQIIEFDERIAQIKSMYVSSSPVKKPKRPYHTSTMIIKNVKR